MGTGLRLLPGSWVASARERTAELAGRDSSGSDLSEAKSRRLSFQNPKERLETQLLKDGFTKYGRALFSSGATMGVTVIVAASLWRCPLGSLEESEKRAEEGMERQEGGAEKRRSDRWRGGVGVCGRRNGSLFQAPRGVSFLSTGIVTFFPAPQFQHRVGALGKVC